MTVLEIGVRDGASLELWRDFGSKCKVYGVDINPKCKELETEQTEIFIGNSEDRNFLRRIKAEVPQIDVFIDDGGHRMNQQIIAFEEFYPHLSPNGVFLCEDIGTSYWKEWGGGYKKEGTFIEYTKNLIDQLNASFSKDERLKVDNFTLSTTSIHYYRNIVVIERNKEVMQE